MIVQLVKKGSAEKGLNAELVESIIEKWKLSKGLPIEATLPSLYTPTTNTSWRCKTRLTVGTLFSTIRQATEEERQEYQVLRYTLGIAKQLR
jgi:hypothetical protein